MKAKTIAARIAVALAGLALLATGHGGATSHAQTAPDAARAKQAVSIDAQIDRACARVTDPQEDEPCWSWSTRGNLARGVVVRAEAATPRHHRIVDACAFATAVRAQTIDWTRTEHLRGDGYALRHGCDPALYAQAPR